MAKQDFVLPRNLNGTLLTKEITFNMLAYYPLLPWYINVLYFQNPKFLFHHLLDGICPLRETPLYRACWGWKYSPWVNRYQIWAFEFAVQETTVIIIIIMLFSKWTSLFYDNTKTVRGDTEIVWLNLFSWQPIFSDFKLFEKSVLYKYTITITSNLFPWCYNHMTINI